MFDALICGDADGLFVALFGLCASEPGHYYPTTSHKHHGLSRISSRGVDHTITAINPSCRTEASDLPI